MSPPYPLSPTRCWHYHFSYLDSGGDCGLGRCKRPAEARCLPPSQSPRLGSRMLNPLLDSHKKYKRVLDQWWGMCPQLHRDGRKKPKLTINPLLDFFFYHLLMCRLICNKNQAATLSTVFSSFSLKYCV